MTGPPRKTLFDQFARNDSSLMSYGGSVFDFYNRVDEPKWARVRDELEEWYSHYPDHGGRLRKDFRSRDQDQHFGAWWELYMYTFYRLLEYEVTPHPTLPNGKKPDFLITRDGAGTYVECKAVIERPRNALEAWIFDCTNKASHPDFILILDIEQEGRQQPRIAQIRTPIEKWLQGLNADDEVAAREAGKPLPTLPLPIGDWQLLYTAYALPPEQRGKYTRLLGLHSARVVMYDNVGLIRRAVRDKGKKYTDVDTPLEYPFIVALNTATVFIDDDEIDDALFGSRSTLFNPYGEPKFTPLGRLPNGYWRADPLGGTRVSAVLMGLNIDPVGAAKDTPRMWINPWAPMPIFETYGLATNTLQDDGQVLRTNGNLVIHELFDLPSDWPLVDKQCG
ncbi:MAG: hypothetical protein QJR12_01285 [Mycobacterium sp.]|uniref:hypothetical protein n=1 Tax=Mycobacterium sp. TaxID=1785 RepID=UPI002629244D|nr:hypothetical protein [Mycobacterium sp.]MDI3312950.1 hypothetical protein [Mycobacterium sp.]